MKHETRNTKHETVFSVILVRQAYICLLEREVNRFSVKP